MSSKYRQYPPWDAHCHLEGAIYPKTRQRLKQFYQLKDYQLFQNYELQYQEKGDPPNDFNDFLYLLRLNYPYFSRPESYQIIMEGILEALNQAGIQYAEVHVNLALMKEFGHQPLQVFEELDNQLNTTEISPARVALVADLPWQFPAEHFKPLLATPHLFQAAGVLGLSIGGDERFAHPETFKKVMARGADLGYKIFCHCGETRGTALVEDVLKNLPIHRLIHALCITKSKKLLKILKQRQIGVDTCLSSNRYLLGISYQQHPWRIFLDHNIPVAFGTDDPAILQINPKSEWKIIKRIIDDKKKLVDILRKSWLQLALCP